MHLIEKSNHRESGAILLMWLNTGSQIFNVYINMYILKFKQLKYHADRNCKIHLTAQAFVLLCYDSFHLVRYFLLLSFCFAWAFP